ncbi:hypothetical protein ACFSQ7_26010 [Paenibacillus rhizoplanae]
MEVMREALLTEAAGSGASRLVTGNRLPYVRLEESLADWQNCEAALVFANGYMANSGVISALIGRGDVVFQRSVEPCKHCGRHCIEPCGACSVPS